MFKTLCSVLARLIETKFLPQGTYLGKTDTCQDVKLGCLQLALLWGAVFGEISSWTMGVGLELEGRNKVVVRMDKAHHLRQGEEFAPRIRGWAEGEDGWAGSWERRSRTLVWGSGVKDRWTRWCSMLGRSKAIWGPGMPGAQCEGIDEAWEGEPLCSLTHFHNIYCAYQECFMWVFWGFFALFGCGDIPEGSELHFWGMRNTAETGCMKVGTWKQIWPWDTSSPETAEVFGRRCTSWGRQAGGLSQFPLSLKDSGSPSWYLLVWVKLLKCTAILHKFIRVEMHRRE